MSLSKKPMKHQQIFRTIKFRIIMINSQTSILTMELNRFQ